MLGLLGLARRRHRESLRDNLTRAGLYRPGMLVHAGMELGKGMAELPLVWLASLPRVFRLVREVRGWEHLEAAKGRGVVLLAPHLGCWEICGMYIASRLPFTALYTPPRQEWVHAMMKEGRERVGLNTVPPTTGGVRALLTRLKAGEAVFILPDQTASGGEGQWLRFLDHPAYMPSLPYRLITSTKARPFVVYAERLSWGRGFCIHIDPLPEAAEAGIEPLARQASQCMSARVRRHPEQYLWSYRLYRRPRSAPPAPEDLA